MVARGVFWQNERTNFCIEKHGSAIACNRYRVYILFFFLTSRARTLGSARHSYIYTIVCVRASTSQHTHDRRQCVERLGRRVESFELPSSIIMMVYRLEGG